MRILGLDFGDKTLGVSISDPFKTFASAYTTIKRKNPIDYKETIAKVNEIVMDKEIDFIVLGYPKNMNNTEGPRCEATKKFMEKLKLVVGVPIELYDERLSTQSAQRSLIEADLRRDKRKEVIDSVAAVYILQGYLNKINNEKQREGLK